MVGHFQLVFATESEKTVSSLSLASRFDQTFLSFLATLKVPPPPPPPPPLSREGGRDSNNGRQFGRLSLPSFFYHYVWVRAHQTFPNNSPLSSRSPAFTQNCNSRAEPKARRRRKNCQDKNEGEEKMFSSFYLSSFLHSLSPLLLSSHGDISVSFPSPSFSIQSGEERRRKNAPFLHIFSPLPRERGGLNAQASLLVGLLVTTTVHGITIMVTVIQVL